MTATSADREALRGLLKDWFLANPNTPLDSKTVVNLFGEESRSTANHVLNQLHSRALSRSSGKRNAGAPGTAEMLEALNTSGTPSIVRGVVYRSSHATYVYDTDAYYRVGKAGGIKRNQFPIFHSSTLSEPARRRLPILPVFPTPDDPKRAQLLARGDETIVIQTLTEVITATIVVTVPR